MIKIRPESLKPTREQRIALADDLFEVECRSPQKSAGSLWPLNLHRTRSVHVPTIVHTQRVLGTVGTETGDTFPTPHNGS